MTPFNYSRAADIGGAITKASGDGKAKYLAGGTTLVDLMKLHVESPQTLIDINRLPFDKIEATDASIRIGGNTRNSAVAYHPEVQKRLPALSQAILSGATPQIRNMASVAGNMMQRTRCYYFRDGASECNKRTPGSGCAAVEGFHRIHAIFGGSDKCFAVNPSDMCVALAAFDAVVHLQGGKGERQVPLSEFFISYGDDPIKETTLLPGELITAVEIKVEPWYTRSGYLKVRDRESYEFALTSAAVALNIDGGVIKDARVAVGGVATKPWRLSAVEKKLVGGKIDSALFAEAAAAGVADAKPRRDNEYKVELLKRTIIRALETVAKL